MNNFARQLGQLQQTAARASKAQHQQQQTGEDNLSEKKKRRRHETTNDSNQIRHHRLRPNNNTNNNNNNNANNNANSSATPYDIDELNIEVSFLCIGAQKAGTTWLHEILRRHPDLSLPDQKEVHFWDWNRRKGLGWYGRQFPSTSTSTPTTSTHRRPLLTLKGEITPCYITLPPPTVREIHHLFPRLRLVFIARDMVDRAWSALLMELRDRVRGLPPGTFHDAAAVVDVREEGRIRRGADPAGYSDGYFMERLESRTHTERSDYAKGLRVWLECFAGQRLVVLDYRDIKERPRELVGRVARHIGVETEGFLGGGGVVGEDVLARRVNSATGGKGDNGYGALRPSLRRKMEDYLRPFSKDFNSLLEELGYSWRINDFDTNASSKTTATVEIASTSTTNDETLLAK